jgi:Protein of unknown function (DUF3489)
MQRTRCKYLLFVCRFQNWKSEGASIEEMMQATDWQQHSVRGFLAGTVKKKLGFPLTSLKPNDGARRYRIETRRAR